MIHQKENLSEHFEALLADPDWVLAHFTLAADLTVMRAKCHFAHSGEAVVSRYDGLPFPALAFWGEKPETIAHLAARLIDQERAFYVLLNERQISLAERAFTVEQVHPEWQMLFSAAPAALDPGSAVSLGPGDLLPMQDLAANTDLMALEGDPFRYGPAFGVWKQGKLVAMAGTHLRVPGAVEIGNIATHTSHRRRGYARQAVAALVQTHVAAGHRVFLMVFQDNQPAMRLYESLGFERLRPMFLMRCRLRRHADERNSPAGGDPSTGMGTGSDDGRGRPADLPGHRQGI